TATSAPTSPPIPRFDPHGRDRWQDSVTNDPVHTLFAEPLTLNGRGVLAAGNPVNVGALYSKSGINVWSVGVILDNNFIVANLAAVRTVAIGVDPDPNPKADATYITNDYSLTITGPLPKGGITNAAPL